MEEKILDEIKENNVESAYVLAYFYDRVCFGKYENGQIIFNRNLNWKFLTQIRIFNKDLEIKFVLNEESNLFEKAVIKEQGESEYFDEDMYIAGTSIVDSNDSFTVIKQNGGSIDIPMLLSDDELKAGIKLKVRNYIETDENNQVVISNSRLVDIFKGGAINE